jgi:uncharacterized Zn-binding protein involved in type VI secretion
MRLLVALSVVVAVACAPSGPPTREADITGTITHVTADHGTALVEERPQETAGSAKASVRITTDTRIWTTDGRRAPATDLVLGANVRVWFDGAVAESYPAQAKAGDIAVAPPALGQQMYVIAKGNPTVIVRVNGREVARVACNSGAAIMSGADLVAPLPWDLSVLRASDGALLLQQHVTQLPQWLVVLREDAGLSNAPVAGPFIPCP